MITERIIYDGLIYTGGFALIIVLSVLINPRIWLQDIPENLKSELPPKNRKEIRQTFVTGFLFSLFIVGFPLYSVSEYMEAGSGPQTFWYLFLHSFEVMMICNILYWLILDILIFNVIINYIRKVPGLKSRIGFTGWKRQIFGLSVGILSCFFISGFVATAAGFFR